MLGNANLKKETNVEQESKKGQTVDALALGGDEGRDKLRKARSRCK